MSKGLNKADNLEKALWSLTSLIETKTNNRPCVFLSHKREDKQECRIIAEYLKDAEIDYYLDELDENLQRAAATDDSSLITESLKKGIRESSHMLVVVSEKTFMSPWIPFEVGYGHSAIVDKSLESDNYSNEIKLAILTLKDISEKILPAFMKTAYLIRGTKSLNNYISSISGKLEKAITEGLIKSHTQQAHPLDSILNWKL